MPNNKGLNQAQIEKRKVLAKMMAEGNGVPNLDPIISGGSPYDVREYLAMLPLGQKVIMGNEVMHVVEKKDRPENTIPNEYKDYYKKNKNLPKVRTLNY